MILVIDIANSSFMTRLLLSTLFAIAIVPCQAQRLSATLFAGASNYQGDLQAKRFTFGQSHLALGLGVQYELTEKWYARAGFTMATIGASDRFNNRNTTRNLNFRSRITEFNIGAEYHLFSLYERAITPYVFGGVAVFHFNPKAIDSNGAKIALRPLSTEGQGFYAGRSPYATTQFAIPFGGGFKMSLSDRVRIGVEVGLRKTFTDYLDDVSTNYVDQALLLANRGSRAVDLAFRGDELKSGLSYPADGAQRGSAKYKDWYYFSGIHINYLLGQGKAQSRKNKTGCPSAAY
jgi:hypothetical protein